MSDEKAKSPRGFKRAYKKAEKLNKEEGRLQNLLQSGSKKAEEYKGRLKEIWQELQIVFRMLSAWKEGKHHFELKTILSLTAAIIYFINPFDIIPDLIPAIGLVDDIGIITYVFKRFEAEIEKFSEWEESQNNAEIKDDQDL